jgi:hypothetical protein
MEYTEQHADRNLRRGELVKAFCLLLLSAFACLGQQQMLLNRPLPLPSGVDTTNIVEWWPMDINGATTPGVIGGFTGTEVASPTQVTGQITNAISFNGSSQYITTTLNNLNFTSGTVTWWQKPSTAYNAATTRPMWGQLTSGNADPEFSCQVFSDNNWYVGWAASGNDARVVLAASSGNYVQSAWHWYAFTWSSLGSGLLMDGVQIGTNSTAPSVSNIAHSFGIGWMGGFTSYFPGAIDDFRVWNAVKSTAALAYTYNRNLAGLP